MFTTNSLYRNYANGNINQKEYNAIHHCIDTAHTTTAWYETDAISITQVIEMLIANGKKRTTALIQKLERLV